MEFSENSRLPPFPEILESAAPFITRTSEKFKICIICQNLEFASYEERPEIPGTSIQNVLISAKGLIHIYLEVAR